MKRRWQREVEESREYESLTHLIELAVEREIDHVGGSSTNSGSSVEYSPNVSNTELLQKIENLQQSVGDVETDVDTIRREVVSTQADKLSREVLEKLPESKANAVHPRELAHEMNEFPREVVGACMKLKDEMGRVKMTDQEQFWKDV